MGKEVKRELGAIQKEGQGWRRESKEKRHRRGGIKYHT